MKLVCLSDTHGRHRELSVPPGDILLHAGDFTRRGKAEEIQDFNAWLGSLPHRHKVVIAGNHDFLFERHPEQARPLLDQAHYLEDSGLELEGLSFWGSPVSPFFFNWAFNRHRGAEMAAHWERIPSGVQVLITHTPPKGLLDRTHLGLHVGCEALKKELDQRLQPLLLVCGHIHENFGQRQYGDTLILNASSLDRCYRPRHPIWSVEVDPHQSRLLSCTPHQAD